MAAHRDATSRLTVSRRHMAARFDQVWTLGSHVVGRAVGRNRVTPAFDGCVRFALLVVNSSKTDRLKLLLLTLAEQTALERVRQIVVVENGSHDGGRPFLDALARQIPGVAVLHRRAADARRTRNAGSRGPPR